MGRYSDWNHANWAQRSRSPWGYNTRNMDWRESNHPACPRGCGELADECACPPAKRNPLGSMGLSQPIGSEPHEDYADDFRGQCRAMRRGIRCPENAERGGYCDIHLETL